jgi:TolB-like protein
LLLSAQQISPDNFAVSYYLGYINIRKGKLTNGIIEWKKYLSRAPNNYRSINLRKQLTLLLLKHAAVYSVGARNRTKKTPSVQHDKSIVIAEFQNRCFSNVTGMGKGLAAMIMDDLQKIDDIQVIDRNMIHTMTKFMHPDQRQISDPINAAILGKSLTSQYTVWGEFTDISENAFHLMSTITDSQQSYKIGTIDIKGTREGFSILEKRMVFGILESIGIHKKTWIRPPCCQLRNPIPVTLTRF